MCACSFLSHFVPNQFCSTLICLLVVYCLYIYILEKFNTFNIWKKIEVFKYLKCSSTKVTTICSPGGSSKILRNILKSIRDDQPLNPMGRWELSMLGKKVVLSPSQRAAPAGAFSSSLCQGPSSPPSHVRGPLLVWGPPIRSQRSHPADQW